MSASGRRKLWKLSASDSVFLLLRRMGLPTNARLEKLALVVRAQQGAAAARFVETLAQAERSATKPALAESEALKFVADLHEGARRFGLSGKPMGG